MHNSCSSLLHIARNCNTVQTWSTQSHQCRDRRCYVDTRGQGSDIGAQRQEQHQNPKWPRMVFQTIMINISSLTNKCTSHEDSMAQAGQHVLPSEEVIRHTPSSQLFHNTFSGAGTGPLKLQSDCPLQWVWVQWTVRGQEMSRVANNSETINVLSSNKVTIHSNTTRNTYLLPSPY